MTLSIVARCARTRQLGVAAVTGTPGVGQLLTWAMPRAGAVATQGWINPYLGIDGIDLLSNGHPAEKALNAVIGLDDDRAIRQVGMVDGNGGSAAYSGQECEDWTGHRTGQDFAVQGNLLESAESVEACAEAFLQREDEDLVCRLIAALCAGDAAGGDRRGALSATVYVVATERYPLWDLRVDDHVEPLPELRRVQERMAETLLPQILRLPTRGNLSGQLTPRERIGLA